MHNALVKVSKGQATGQVPPVNPALLKLPACNTKMAGSWSEDLFSVYNDECCYV